MAKPKAKRSGNKSPRSAKKKTAAPSKEATESKETASVQSEGVHRSC